MLRSRRVSTLRDNGRDHCASMRAKLMKHHDLNPAILYAVQLGFSLFSFVFCLTCVADLMEPNIGFCSGRFRATRHPHQGRLRRPQTSRFRSIFQALFCLNTNFVGVVMLRVIPTTLRSLQRGRAASLLDRVARLMAQALPRRRVSQRVPPGQLRVQQPKCREAPAALLPRPQ
jgi:hypothetical protein